jgi:SnoaL-like domain
MMATGGSRDSERGVKEAPLPPLPVVQDEDSLRSLSIAYAAAVDGRDGAALASLFEVDGALVVPDYPSDLRPVIVRAGREALERIPDGLRRYARTFHTVSNQSYAVDGDHARGEVQCTAHHLSATGVGGPDDPADRPVGIDTVWFIRYRDAYHRSDAGWRFVRRELHLQWVEEHPVTVLSTIDAAGEAASTDQP